MPGCFLGLQVNDTQFDGEPVNDVTEVNADSADLRIADGVSFNQDEPNYDDLNWS